MSRPFDPYHAWLGIPAEEQPPDHYRLLGIPRFESNPAVIEHAADRQMTYLKTFKSAKQAPWSQKLLNEVAQAKLVLLNAGEKAAYDRELARRRAHGAQSDAKPGAASFEHYELLEQLNASRTGQVFKARHKALGRLVALKILSQEAVGSQQLVERFLRKVKILARMSHPNLVAAYEAGQRGGTYYLAMEYVDGHDLRSILKTRGALGVDEAVGYVAQAAAGLGYAHSHGVYHRNVKPSNLLVDKQGVVKLVGLGLAHVDASDLVSENSLGAELTAQGQVMGTCDFMAPEQAVDARSVDARADIYGLGCTLHALLTGRPPYPGKSPMQQVVAHRSQPIPSLPSVRSDVSERLQRVFQQMLAKRPEERQQSMAEVIDQLEWAMTPEPAPAPPVHPAPVMASAPPVPEESEPEGESSHFLRNAAMVLLPVLVLGAWLVFSWPTPQPRPRAPRKPASAVLAVDWPEEERAGGQLEIDGQRVPLADAGPVQYEVRPGERVIVARRPSFEAAEEKVAIAPGASITVRPQWRPTPRVVAAPEPARLIENRERAPQPQAVAEKPEASPAAVAAPAEPPKEAPPKATRHNERAIALIKRSVPDEQTRREAERAVRAAHQPELQKATAGQSKIELANRLLELALPVQTEAGIQYAMVCLARDQAIEAGAWPVAWRAIDQLAEYFLVDRHQMRAEALLVVAKNARTLADHGRVGAEALLLLEDALDENSIAAAGAMAKLALAEAGRARDKEGIQQARSRARDVEQAAKAYAPVEEALGLLASKPDDRDANGVVGRYECLFHGDWPKGLPLLAKGPEGPLRTAAEHELAAPTSAAELAAVAEEWWTLAEKDAGPARNSLLIRAAHWYRRAKQKAGGMLNAKLDKRIATLAPLVAQSLPRRIVNTKDGSVLILIRGGTFLAGEERFPVELPPYYLGLHEVTNAQYRKFVALTRRDPPISWPEGKFPEGLEDRPVTMVSWEDADTYCRWAGLRLPRELEWEKGARGTDGRLYPWGNDWDVNRSFNGRNMSQQRFGPVLGLPEGRSPFGLYNMAGNAAEWCADWFHHRIYERYRRGNLSPGAVATDRVVRGGSTGTADPEMFRCDARQRRDTAGWDYGFRVAYTFVP